MLKIIKLSKILISKRIKIDNNKIVNICNNSNRLNKK